MYYVRKREEWDDQVGNGRDFFMIVDVIRPFHGQKISEAELRFALAVIQQDIKEDVWTMFVNALPALIRSRRVDMDYIETRNMKVAAAASIARVLQPLRELIMSDVTSRLNELSRNWGLDGVEYPMAKMVERRLVSDVLKLAKDQDMCQCGHHARHHRADQNSRTSERPCRACANRGRQEPCYDFKPVRDF